jgi:hypothetical protein
MPELVLDQFWRCPECTLHMMAGQPALLSPPKCHCSGSAVEMEQVTAEGVMAAQAIREDSSDV